MTDQAYVIALEIQNSETAEVEREYAVCLALPEMVVITVGGQGPPGRDAIAADLPTDPLAYYILARS
ncbi:MAG: hypothetical protein WA173_08865 [Pseudomonas sp.]|uniref:hypothetical protein n=1 Tax=Pseudomonas sp. TaxID=306 RepID=UPI003BB4AAED